MLYTQKQQVPRQDSAPHKTAKTWHDKEPKHVVSPNLTENPQDGLLQKWSMKALP